ncbi:MAG: MmgE/PrpD family protein [Chloroflexi bacterium]|nr:MmgE/PrpD family protein [Chloroflexota bacterium]
MGITERLANWVATVKYEDVPPEAYEQAKKSILDYLGTTVYGSTTPLGQIMIDYTREQGGTAQARVLGTSIKTTSVNAAFANGALGHSEDFDDLGGAGGHPAVTLTPTVLALGEELNLSGKEMLLAWVVGYEVGTRLSANLHPDRDWHPTAIFGTMAAVAAASKLLKLDVWKTRMAMGIAGSEAAGLRRNFGTMTKPFHPGNAARSGIVAAKLASRGYTADPDIIEGRQGYADCFGGVKCNLPAVTQLLGKLYYLAAEGTRIKPWPCCGGNHTTLTGMLDVVSKLELNPEDVEHIEHVGAGVPGLGALIRSEVHEGLAGKFCLEYNIAASIIDRKVDLTTFTNERAAKGDLQEFMTKVHRSQNPDVALRHDHIANGDNSAWVAIKMKDGTEHKVELGPAMHLTGDAVVDKFRLTAGSVFKSDALGKAVQTVQKLETLPSARNLVDAVTLK